MSSGSSSASWESSPMPRRLICVRLRLNQTMRPPISIWVCSMIFTWQSRRRRSTNLNATSKLPAKTSKWQGGWLNCASASVPRHRQPKRNPYEYAIEIAELRGAVFGHEGQRAAARTGHGPGKTAQGHPSVRDRRPGAAQGHVYRPLEEVGYRRSGRKTHEQSGG